MNKRQKKSVISSLIYMKDGANVHGKQKRHGKRGT